MMIYRGAGWMTLFTPLAMLMLMMWLWPDSSVKPGNTSLMGIGSAINQLLMGLIVLGFVLNRELHPDGVRHHFFFIPMQWPALLIMLACAVIALLK
jgi:hypothetical protein